MHHLPRWMIATATVLMLVPVSALGCINDSDSLQDELQSRGPAHQVISGQVARHGVAYYTRRLEQSLARLAQNPDELEDRYDAAGALMRLGKPDAAIPHLLHAQHLEAGRYKTHSNLGVAYLLRAESSIQAAHKRSDMEAALRQTQLALERSPDAHFGAGWLFERMIKWKQEALRSGRPERTMLGRWYTGSPSRSIVDAAEVQAEGLGSHLDRNFDAVGQMLTLLRGHPDFADGYFVLGRNLHAVDSRHLALRAYIRALDLGHPRRDAIHENIDAIVGEWNSSWYRERHGGKVPKQPKAQWLATVREEFRIADRWSTAFRRAEAELIATSRGLPDLDAVTRVLKRQGISRSRPGDLPSGSVPMQGHLHHRGEDGTPAIAVMTPPSGDGPPPQHVLWLGMGLLGVGLLGALLATRGGGRRSTRRRYPHRSPRRRQVASVRTRSPRIEEMASASRAFASGAF